MFNNQNFISNLQCTTKATEHKLKMHDKFLDQPIQKTDQMGNNEMFQYGVPLNAALRFLRFLVQRLIQRLLVPLLKPNCRKGHFQAISDEVYMLNQMRIIPL